MTTEQQDASQKGSQDRGRPDLTGAIAKHVTQALGPVDATYRVQVRSLWGQNYRANVIVGEEVAMRRIAHSYFLRVDGDGNIVEANPPIVRVNEPQPLGN